MIEDATGNQIELFEMPFRGVYGQWPKPEIRPFRTIVELSNGALA